ncbi:hydrolase 2, exosortase A system-associated [Denitromonas ohlonensis]|uniref:Hydrolase 2, exosortase A system-associated n=2 Tax=Denitromonas TaxID=139331 RepID=A0A557RCK6_9RHOO|nr:hydrolase 2, exosortase A system-associated [Denitromonas ohlonensis]TVO62874.1 hydrolase 2, exosortase A system-associated [Denitromonas ohlonensis]TVO75009.1 hydrolase 2, exosortase A system-associated [Denitromonas ohlonensis]
MAINPLFLDSAGARLFALAYMPAGTPRGALLYIPPFAEEMNRCRALAAEQARALANAGYACLLLDLFGTGDSEGELEAASWDIWQQNVCDAADYLAASSGCHITLWGLRLGGLLAASVAAKHPNRFKQVLLWQPTADGNLFMNQYLRLRVANLMDRGLPAETTQSIREALSSGSVVEVAGYPLSAPLVEGISSCKLAAMEGLSGMHIDWYENVAEEGGALSIATQRAVDAMASKGVKIKTHTFAGAPLWQLHKRDAAPALIAQTTQQFAQE